MTTTSAEHDLKTLIQSFHPIIVVETLEEDRLRSQLGQVASDLDAPLFVWTATRGLARWPGLKGFTKTETALSALRHIETLTVDGIFCRS